jgi:hypothetical protein
MVPENPPIEVPVGESFSFTCYLTNNTDQEQIVDVWIMAQAVLGGSPYGPVHRWNNLRLFPHQTLSGTLSQDVPEWTPLMTFEYIGYAGDYPSGAVSSSSFEFTARPERETVTLELRSTKHNRVVSPGEMIDWKIKAYVSTHGNLGLAMFAADLDQDPDNPEWIDFVPGDGAPTGMASFDRPAGLTNPSDDPWGSGYGGTPVEVDGRSVLSQIGGAQNSFGVPGPCLGQNSDICMGQQVAVETGIGHAQNGQLIATGSFPAPAAPGTYEFLIDSAMANTFGQVHTPPAWSTTLAAPVVIRKPLVRIHVSGRSRHDGPSDPGPRRSDENRDVVILPPEGAVLNRTHAQFRWAPFDEIPAGYMLWIVEDDLSGDPFGGSSPLMSYPAASHEPRTVVTGGLAFGKPYAWCVTDGGPPTDPGAVVSPIRRFSVMALPDWMPAISILEPGGAGPLEPGMTFFKAPGQGLNRQCLLAIDENSDVVYFLHTEDLYFVLGMIRGRLFGGNQQAIVRTLDGRDIWSSPAAVVVHHDGFPKADGHFFALTQETRTVIIDDEPVDLVGDRIVEFNRHTKEVVWSWSTFDYWSVEDYSDPDEWAHEAWDWTHCNTVFYDEPQDSVYLSSRHLSRISRIDYTTGEIIYNMGKDMPSGDTDFGHNLFTYQHAAEMMPSGRMMVYDNGNLREPLTEPRQTKAIELAFNDPGQPTDAWIVWEYGLVDDLGDPVFCQGWGDADRLPGGNTLITGGEYNTIYEVNAGGQLVRRITVEQGSGCFYQAEHVPDLVTDTPGDTDGDWDLDLADLGALQCGFTGPGSASLSFPVTLSDYDGDDDIDDEDLRLFLYWMSGVV